MLVISSILIMSNQQVVSGEKYGPEVDLWSLGCLLYCLLVGKPPFESDNIKNTLNRVVSGNYWVRNNRVLRETRFTSIPK